MKERKDRGLRTSRHTRSPTKKKKRETDPAMGRGEIDQNGRNRGFRFPKKGTIARGEGGEEIERTRLESIEVGKEGWEFTKSLICAPH